MISKEVWILVNINDVALVKFMGNTEKDLWEAYGGFWYQLWLQHVCGYRAVRVKLTGIIEP